MAKQKKKRKNNHQQKLGRRELRESVPFMELNRKNRRQMAKNRGMFKGEDRGAWRILTHRKENGDV